MKKNNKLRKGIFAGFNQIRTIILMTFVISAIQVWGQTPQTIHYQGLLNDASGNPVNDTKLLEFRIYNTETGGTALWTEQHPAVEITDGLFSVVLGESSSLAGQFSSYPVYITFAVDGQEMLPRQKFQSVPYAIRAKDAESAYWADEAGLAFDAVNAQKLNNITSDGFVQQDASGNATITGTMTANAFVGDGSGITNLPLGSDTDWTINGNYVYNLNDSIGIGVANPKAKLDVAGRIYQTSTGYSTFLGYMAGENDDLTYNQNVFIGYRTGKENTSGYSNTAVGSGALTANTTGDNNTATGLNALYDNTTGIQNTAYGSKAMSFNTTGIRNTANGYEALFSNTTGNYNIAVGYHSLYNNSTGARNIATGNNSLFLNTTGSDNIAAGAEALYYNNTGYKNIAIGFHKH